MLICIQMLATNVLFYLPNVTKNYVTILISYFMSTNNSIKNVSVFYSSLGELIKLLYKLCI